MSGADVPSSLDLASVRTALGSETEYYSIVALAECDSTNSRLMAAAEAGANDGSVLVTDRQTAGRGRRGRTWHSSPDDSLTFSLLRRFPRDSEAPAALALVAGLAVARALDTLGLRKVTLKWPNDVLHEGGKLAGILIELQPGDLRSAVIGIGINLRLPPDLPEEVARLAATLDHQLPDIRRETVLGAVLHALSFVLRTYERHGFGALRAEWNVRDAYAGRLVEVRGENFRRSGICRGADSDGALLLEAGSATVRVIAGEVSLRTPGSGVP